MPESIKTLHNKLKEREITSKDLVQEHFDRIEKRDDELNAFISTFREEALAEADRVDKLYDQGEELSPLAGVPFSAKDVFNITGYPTTAGSHILEGYQSPYTATAIQRLLDKNAVFIGKNNQDSFGFGSSTENSDFGVSRNPWDQSKVPGGSSGGSAAAVAAGMGVYSVAEDTGGSIRQPACFCGVTGLKVTYGRVSRYGTVAYASSLDTIGPIARSVEDVAYVMSAIAGNDTNDATTLPGDLYSLMESLPTREHLKGITIGVPKEFMSEQVDTEIINAIEAAVGQLVALGAKRKDVSLPFTQYGAVAYYIIAPSEASSNLSRYDGIRYPLSVRTGGTLEKVYTQTRGSGFNEEAQRRIMLGTYALSAGYYDAYFEKAQKVRTLMKQDYEQAFQEVDIMIAPVSPVLPFDVGTISEDPLAMWLVDVFSLPINIAGVPSLALPCGFSNSDLPIGFQLIGPQLSEELLLQVGYLYQQVTDWHEREP